MDLLTTFSVCMDVSNVFAFEIQTLLLKIKASKRYHIYHYVFIILLFPLHKKKEDRVLVKQNLKSTS